MEVTNATNKGNEVRNTWVSCPEKEGLTLLSEDPVGGKQEKLSSDLTGFIWLLKNGYYLTWWSLALGLKMRPASDRALQPPDTVRTLLFVFFASSCLHISHSVEGSLLTPQMLNSGVHLLKEPS